MRRLLVKGVFSNMASFNKNFPSEKQIANSIRLGKPINIDHGWKSSRTTAAERVLLDLCEKVYRGHFDEDLNDKWQDLRTDRPSFEQVTEASSKLQDAMAELQAATAKDNQLAADIGVVSACNGPFDTLTGKCRGCDVCL